MRAWVVASGVAVAALSVALLAHGEVGGPDDPAASVVADAGALDDAALDVGITAVATGPSDASTDRGADAAFNGEGFAFALHGGLALPFGRAKNSDIQDVVGYSIPVGVDIGYFVTPHWFVGGYFTYGIASTANTPLATCPPELACGVAQFRFGVTTAWRFRPRSVVDPWTGLSLGYDLLNLTGTDSTGATVQSGTDDGIELGLQGGVDFRPAPFWGFGPYLELSGGHYWFDSPSFHLWVTPGLRLFTLLSGI